MLGGIADTVAQTLTAVRERAVRKKGGPGKDDFLAIEIHDLDKRNPFNENDLIPNSKRLPPPFDFERTTRFMSYGFLMSPIQHRWFKFLSATFPVTKTATWLPALKRVAFDQFLFAPAGLAAFFTFMTIAEGGGKRAVQRKFQDVYVPSLKANYMVWPAVQIINFRIMPIQYQIVSSLALVGFNQTNTLPAFCIQCRYCLDCLPFLDQLRRRRYCINKCPCTTILMNINWTTAIPTRFPLLSFCVFAQSVGICTAPGLSEFYFQWLEFSTCHLQVDQNEMLSSLHSAASLP